MNAPHDDHDLESSLTRSFNTAADGFAPHDDWDDLTGRIRRSDRTRRFSAIALTVMLTGAAITGGFVVGEHQGSGGAPGSVRRGAALPEPTGPATFDPSSTKTPEGSIGEVIAFRRTATDGTEIRVWSRFASTPAPGRLSPPCQLAGELRFAVSTADGVSSMRGLVSANPTPRAMLITSRESRPVPMTIAVVALNVRTVTVRFPDGSTDTMTPVRGLAVLTGDTVAPLDPTVVQDQPISTDGVAVTITGTNGATTVVPVALSSPSNDNSLYGCTPLLPSGKQPSDPVAARAAVTAAFNSVYDIKADKPWTDLVDDASRLDELFAQARKGQVAELVDSVRFHLDEIVFSAPDRAAVLFTLFSKIGTMTNEYGEAHLVDGRWKITRATVCSSLAIVSVSCDPAGPR